MRIGIFGAGQLGHFLCLAARNLGMKTTVVGRFAHEPAAMVADELLLGGLDEVSVAEQLADSCDVITFEIDSVGPAVLDYLEQRAKQGDVRVAPRPETMRVVQNKAKQKDWLQAKGIPTLPGMPLDGANCDPAALASQVGLPLVQKAALGGYDGRGVQVIHTAERVFFNEVDRLLRCPLSRLRNLVDDQLVRAIAQVLLAATTAREILIDLRKKLVGLLLAAGDIRDHR